jgi:hypothetical protein
LEEPAAADARHSGGRGEQRKQISVVVDRERIFFFVEFLF